MDFKFETELPLPPAYPLQSLEKLIPRLWGQYSKTSFAYAVKLESIIYQQTPRPSRYNIEIPEVGEFYLLETEIKIDPTVVNFNDPGYLIYSGGTFSWLPNDQFESLYQELPKRTDPVDILA